MDGTRKSFALIIILIMAIASLTLLVAKPANAQTITKPSVTQFTLNLIGLSQVQIIVENQPLVLTTSNESLYYNIRVKEHNSDNWTELYTNNRPDLPILKGTIPIQSDSQNTTLDYSAYGYYQGTELDFQVIAMYGHYYTQESASHDPLVPSQTVFSVLADGASGWSSTQTLTIGQNSATTTPSPTVPEFPILMVLPFFASVLLIPVYIKHRRTSHE
jgi:hypothetical protein